jgi:hypothetical protein
MKEESDKKSSLTPVIGSTITSLIVVVAGLLIEYKTGWFQRLDNPASVNSNASPIAAPTPTQQLPVNNRPQFPTGRINAPPSTPSISQKVDIGKLYRRFMHDSMAAAREYADGRVLEVTADVSSKHLLQPENQPFTLVLESDGYKLFCTFNDEDEIKGIDDWDRVTVRGQLRVHNSHSGEPAHLDLYNCHLIAQDWKFSIYLKVGLAAFMLLSLLLYILWRSIIKQ